EAAVRARLPHAKLATSAADVSSADDAAGALRRTLEAFGRLDVLVNNAAVRDHSSIENSQIENWQRLLATNLLGAVNFCKAALGELRRSGNASVVNVSSCYAVAARKGMPIYDATKAAL